MINIRKSHKAYPKSHVYIKAVFQVAKRYGKKHIKILHVIAKNKKRYTQKTHV